MKRPSTSTFSSTSPDAPLRLTTTSFTAMALKMVCPARSTAP
jgi:hypothetical protein